MFGRQLINVPARGWLAPRAPLFMAPCTAVPLQAAQQIHSSAAVDALSTWDGVHAMQSPRIECVCAWTAHWQRQKRCAEVAASTFS